MHWEHLEMDSAPLQIHFARLEMDLSWFLTPVEG